MRLFEAILAANHRALAGDANAGLHPTEFESELPVVALTCIDPRLNPLLPQVLGILPEHFIWLRNAGNIITGPLSSTTRSLSLACAVKGGKEIAIIGHTDCLVGKTTTMELLDRLRGLGVERHLLPENLNEFFGLFASERQNVIKAVDIVRRSPLIGPKIPVHGLLVDTQSGRLEWIVNGYQSLGAPVSVRPPSGLVTQALDTLQHAAGFNIGEMKMPDVKIGEVVTKVGQWIQEKEAAAQVQVAAPAAPPTPPPIAIASPPRISGTERLRARLRR